MKLVIDKKKLKTSLQNLARNCGYVLQYQELNRKSFIRRLTKIEYPRFHLYIEENGQSLIATLHLDQKKPVYKGAASHQGEYGGTIIENEFNRIKNILL